MLEQHGPPAPHQHAGLLVFLSRVRLHSLELSLPLRSASVAVALLPLSLARMRTRVLQVVSSATVEAPTWLTGPASWTDCLRRSRGSRRSGSRSAPILLTLIVDNHGSVDGEVKVVLRFANELNPHETSQGRLQVVQEEVHNISLAHVLHITGLSTEQVTIHLAGLPMLDGL